MEKDRPSFIVVISKACVAGCRKELLKARKLENGARMTTLQGQGDLWQ